MRSHEEECRNTGDKLMIPTDGSVWCVVSGVWCVVCVGGLSGIRGGDGEFCRRWRRRRIKRWSNAVE